MAEEQQQSQVQAAAGQAASALIKKVAQQAVRKIGAVFGGVGALATEVLGRVIGRFWKWALAAIAAPFFLIFIIIFAFIAWLFGGGETPPAEAAPTGLCSTVTPTTLYDEPATITRINDNMDVYKSAAAAADVPWEMLAAMHYLETGNNSTAANMWQFDPPPAGVDVNNFVEATNYAAEFLQRKASTGSLDDPAPLRADMNPADRADEVNIKDAFWGYNGRADWQRDIAASLGFDPVTEGFEGSGYVMNNWDAARVGMIHQWIDMDPTSPTYGQLIVVNLVHDGAWKVYILLRNATYDSNGKITKINEGCPVSDGSAPSGCPITGTITTPMGIHIPGYTFNPEHHGVDIADGPGTNTPVHSPMNGTASLDVDNVYGGGNMVVIKNGPYTLYFLHLLDVGRVSGPVTVGQVIGKEDSSPVSFGFGEHLHYGVYKDGVRQNPTDFMPAVTLNYTQPADNDFTGYTEPAGSNWGSCNALP